MFNNKGCILVSCEHGFFIIRKIKDKCTRQFYYSETASISKYNECFICVTGNIINEYSIVTGRRQLNPWMSGI